MQQLRQIFKYTNGLRPLMAIIATGSVVGALSAFINPFIIKDATDWIVAVIQDHAAFDWQRIAVYAALLIVLTLVTVAITDISGYFGDQLAIRMRRQLSTAYFQHLLELPQSYYDDEVTGKVVNRLSRAVGEITQFLQFFSNNLLQLLLMVGITVVVLSVYSWPLALVLLALVPVNLLLTARTSKLWQELEAKKNHHFDVASGRFTEVVGQMRLVKSFRSERREYNAFANRMTKMVTITRRQSRHWHVMNVWRSLAYGVVNAIILVTLFVQTANRQLTLGDMAMLIALVQQASFPLRNLSFFVDSYQRAAANSKDFLEAMAVEEEASDEGKLKLMLRSPDIEFRNVSFGYGQQKNVLHGISFRVAAGDKVALVGESGAGKSTIASLLMALYKPNEGQVMLGNHDVASVRKADVRKAIATVFQEASLFSGTIRENIAYGRPNATDDEIMTAAKAANADVFIGRLEKGINTEIGERGIKLSGGQKQRIAIARAILKDAPFLVLDEATSSLDSKAEHEVQEALERLMKGRTTLIIAHRLSTIASVDTIVTLRDGKVDEIGSPAKLASSGGIYSELLQLQMHATERDKKRLAKYEISA